MKQFKNPATVRLFLSCFLILSFLSVFSQENEASKNIVVAKIDSLYREDQFYLGFTYNNLRDTPMGYSKGKFSTGFSAGFLRDMPINKKRTVAFAAGMGLTYNNYNQNIGISSPNEIPVYTLLDGSMAYSKNKFSQLFIDLPIEFRWRTSTYESHKFWRIYGGFKWSYLVYDRSILSEGLVKTLVKGNKDFNKFNYGAYISSGFNTVNVYVYYGLNCLFKSAKIRKEALVVKSLNIGIQFYIL